MAESEKRSRGVFSRRQQQQNVYPSTTSQPQNKTSQYRPKRRMSDFMMGVAAGLSSRKNNPTQAGVVLPKHLDFSVRDRSDVTGKRRFQVKLPCRLMVVLTLVFLILPGLIFIQRELHIHDHNTSHYKTEKFVNVDTKEVWNDFRLATTSEKDVVQQGAGETTTEKDAVQPGAGGNRTEASGESEVHHDRSSDAVSSFKNSTQVNSIDVQNVTNSIQENFVQNDSGKDHTEVAKSNHLDDNGNLAHEDNPSVTVVADPIDQKNHSSPIGDISFESINKTLHYSNDDNKKSGKQEDVDITEKVSR